MKDGIHLNLYGDPYNWYGSRRPQSVWIASEMRVHLIKEGIERAGSLNALGRVLGYRSRNHPGWSVQQILIGRQGFPMERLEKMSDFVGISMDEILKYKVSPEYITPGNTRIALKEYGLLCYLLR